MVMEAEFSILSFARPGAGEVPIGILLFDHGLNQLRARFRQDWEQVAPEDDAEVLAALSDDLAAMGRELGARRFLEYLEDTLSHSLRISTRDQIQTDHFDELIDSLYTRYVELAD